MENCSIWIELIVAICGALTVCVPLVIKLANTITAFAKENIKYPSKLVALNAANEVAVNRYLHDNIFFTDIYTIVKRIVDDTKAKKHLSFNEIKKIDKIARKEALR